jgi:lipase (class 3)
LSSPWTRPPLLLDWYVAALAAAASYDGGQQVVDVLSAIEPVVVTTYLSPIPLFPNFMVGISDHFVYIVVPGTRNVQQGIADVLGSPQLAHTGIAGAQCHYFATGATTCYGAASAQLLAAAPGRKIVAIGHSLGGSIAELMAYILAVATQQVPLVLTFGEPRVGDDTYASALPAQSFRGLVGDSDPVPGVPPVTWGGFQPGWPIPFDPPGVVEYKHGGSRQGLSSSGELGALPALAVPDVIAGIWSAVTIRSHAISTYLGYLANGLNGTLPFQVDSGYPDTTHLDSYAATFGLPPIPWPVPAPPAPPPAVVAFFPGGFGGSMNIKFELDFTLASGQGYSETYYTTGYGDLNVSYTAALQMCNLRRAFLYRGHILKSIRMSNADVQRQAVVRKFTPTQGRGQISPSSPFNAGAPDNYGVEVQMFHSTGYRMRTILFRGLSLADVDGSGTVGLSAPTETALRAFLAALVGSSAPLGGNTWGIRHRVVGTKYTIQSITDTLRTVALTLLPGDFTALIALNATYWLIGNTRGDKLVSAIYKAKNTGQTSPIIEIPGAFNSGIYIPKSGYIAQVTYTYPVWSTFLIVDEGSRKVGRPSGLDRGARSRQFSRH